MKMVKHHKPAPHVPFIALADIAWQIIIFFLVASSFARSDSLNVEVPSGAKPSGGTAETNLTVSAGEAALMIDGKSVDLKALQAELARRLAGKTTDQGKSVIVQYKDDLTFQRNAEILYAIQKAGGIVIFSEDAGQ